MLIQAVSLIGASLILGAYVANQRGWSGPERIGYNLSNLLGAVFLGWVAVVDQRVGFILLELVWAVVSVPPLINSFRSKRTEQTS